MKRLVVILTVILSIITVSAKTEPIIDIDSTTKKERNFVKEGNIAFNDSSYQKAIEYYNKALQIDPANDLIKFNIATAQFAEAKGIVNRSLNDEIPENVQQLIQQADSTYMQIFQNTPNKYLKEICWLQTCTLQY